MSHTNGRDPRQREGSEDDRLRELEQEVKETDAQTREVLERAERAKEGLRELAKS